MDKVKQDDAASRGTALIVDDDPVSLQITERMFRHLSVEVVTASRSYGLLNRIATYRPTVVLLDVNMPGLDGPTLVSLVRGDPEIAKTRILLHSALDAEELAQKAVRCGADGFIPKAAGLLHLEQSILRWLTR